jgi:hypothetical protein
MLVDNSYFKQVDFITGAEKFRRIPQEYCRRENNYREMRIFHFLVHQFTSFVR